MLQVHGVHPRDLSELGRGSIGRKPSRAPQCSNLEGFARTRDPTADLHGCNISCRIFRRRVRCDRSLSCTQFCRGVGWTHLSLKLTHLSYLDGLQPYYCNKYSFWDTRVTRVWLNSPINPRVLCVSNTDPGMTLKHRDYGPLGSGRYISLQHI